MSDRTIWKFDVLLKPEFVVEMPRGAELLAVQVQQQLPVFWAAVEPGNPPVRRQLYLLGTGHPMIAPTARYVGTFQLDLFVGHVFDGGEIS